MFLEKLQLFIFARSSDSVYKRWGGTPKEKGRCSAVGAAQNKDRNITKGGLPKPRAVYNWRKNQKVKIKPQAQTIFQQKSKYKKQLKTTSLCPRRKWILKVSPGGFYTSTFISSLQHLTYHPGKQVCRSFLNSGSTLIPADWTTIATLSWIEGLC